MEVSCTSGVLSIIYKIKNNQVELPKNQEQSGLRFIDQNVEVKVNNTILFVRTFKQKPIIRKEFNLPSLFHSQKKPLHPCMASATNGKNERF